MKNIWTLKRTVESSVVNATSWKGKALNFVLSVRKATTNLNGSVSQCAGTVLSKLLSVNELKPTVMLIQNFIQKLEEKGERERKNEN